MKKSKQTLRKVLCGVIGLGSLVALSACTKPNSDTATKAPASESPAASSSPAAESPAASSSPAAQAPTATSSPLAQATASSSPSAQSPTSTGESKNLVEVAAGDQSFSTLVKAVKAAGLTETLSGKGPYTVFAPTDQAFAALPKGTLDKLLKPENKQQLVKVLTYHVVPGEVTSSQIKAGDVKTVEGSPVAVKVDSANNSVKVNDAKVTKADVKASNGVIHVIDKVLLPPDVK